RVCQQFEQPFFRSLIALEDTRKKRSLTPSTRQFEVLLRELTFDIHAQAETKYPSTFPNERFWKENDLVASTNWQRKNLKGVLLHPCLVFCPSQRGSHLNLPLHASRFQCDQARDIQ